MAKDANLDRVLSEPSEFQLMMTFSSLGWVNHREFDRLFEVEKDQNEAEALCNDRRDVPSDRQSYLTGHSVRVGAIRRTSLVRPAIRLNIHRNDTFDHWLQK